MQKSSIFLVLVGGLIILGLALSVWSNQMIFEDFVKNEGKIMMDEKLMVETHMEKSEKGIFAVEILELKENIIYATVTDPLGSQVVREQVDKEAYEGYFDVTGVGNYTLTLENTGQTEIYMAGYIGPEPDATKRTMAFVSIYVLIIGLIGMVIAIIYAIIKRKSIN